MQLTQLHDPKDGQMNVVGLMSGSGSNLRKILDFEKKLESERGKSPYHMAVIFSDCFDSNATTIGKEHDLPVVVRDISGFYSAREKLRRDLQVRAEFDADTVQALSPFDVTVAAYGGYMSIATEPLINAYLGINVHPADLSISEMGKRKYTGDNAVRDAILAGEKYIGSTTHIIEQEVDYGRILMISSPLEVILGNDFNPDNKDSLNKTSDLNRHCSRI
ncbi:hypothetical protein HQ545_02915 [Candidatus Woesearchaeota archaeon]|nr:hypothetical protein [Candidatus Woesearchaeota archaeon]